MLEELIHTILVILVYSIGVKHTRIKRRVSLNLVRWTASQVHHTHNRPRYIASGVRVRLRGLNVGQVNRLINFDTLKCSWSSCGPHLCIKWHIGYFIHHSFGYICAPGLEQTCCLWAMICKYWSPSIRLPNPF